MNKGLKMLRLSVLFFLLCMSASVLTLAPEAQALEFVRTTQNGTPVLWIKDKEYRDSQGRQQVEGFVSGDSKKLQKYMNKGGFREVWLDSNGGNLNEGMVIGRILHNNNAFVRVPKEADCISSCSIAFLGGAVRAVDPGATYQVHMFSAFNSDSTIKLYWGICTGDRDVLANLLASLFDISTAKAKSLLQNKTETELRQALQELVKNNPHSAILTRCSYLWNTSHDEGRLETALRTIAKDLAQEDSVMGIKLFLYFQEMRNGQIAPRVKKEIEQMPVPDVYTLGRSVQEDLQAIQTEGALALQRILMDSEMNAVQQVYKKLSTRTDLGSQATPALAYLDRMLGARIVHTQALSDGQLEGWNYDNLVEE